MKECFDYDVAVIGSESAGFAAARTAKRRRCYLQSKAPLFQA